MTMPVAPVKHQDTPAWVVFVVLVVVLFLFLAATYVGIATYQNSAAIRVIGTNNHTAIKITEANSAVTRKDANNINAYAIYIGAYLAAICKAEPGCIPPKLPVPERLPPMP